MDRPCFSGVVLGIVEINVITETINYLVWNYTTINRLIDSPQGDSAARSIGKPRAKASEVLLSLI